MYTSPDYHPSQVAKRTIRCKPNGEFIQFDINDKGQTIRESVPNLASIPREKVQEARDLQGQMFGQVYI